MLLRLNLGRFGSNCISGFSVPLASAAPFAPWSVGFSLAPARGPHTYQATSMASLRRSSRISSAASLTPDVLVMDVKAEEPLAKRAVSRKRKAATPPREADGQMETDTVPRPSTPPPKKRRGRPPAAKTTSADAEPQPPVPATPSRSAASRAPPETPKTPRPRHPAVNRLANPDVSNAMLISPETSRIVSALPLDSSSSMSSTTKTSTASILDDACAHLVRVDPRMQKLVDTHYCKPFSPASLAEKVDPFESLASGIISQQVSGAAARAIKTRFVNLFKQGGEAGEGVDDQKADEKAGTEADKEKRTFPQPSQVAVMSIEKLRSAGLSQRKAEYLKGLGEKFVSGELSTQLLAEAPYDTLVERLVAVRGLGLWSVEMFAMFGLKRTDVFSVGDLGVQRGMAAFAGRDIAKLKRAGTASKKNAKWKYMAEKEMVAMAEPFRPYRSVFMWYMWQVESVDVSTMG